MLGLDLVDLGLRDLSLLDLGPLGRGLALLVLGLRADVLACKWIELLGLFELIRAGLRAMLRYGAGQLGAQLLGVSQYVVASASQIRDHSLDVLPALRSVL